MQLSKYVNEPLLRLKSKVAAKIDNKTESGQDIDSSFQKSKQENINGNEAINTANKHNDCDTKAHAELIDQNECKKVCGHT